MCKVIQHVGFILFFIGGATLCSTVRFGLSARKGHDGILNTIYAHTLSEDKKYGVFALFDGHRDNKAAEYAQKNLFKNIRDSISPTTIQEGFSATNKGILSTYKPKVNGLIPVARSLEG